MEIPLRKKKIAFIGSLKSFFAETLHKKGGKEIKYLCVQNVADTEGRRFDDYIIGNEAYKLPEYAKILSLVQSKLRRQ